MLHLLRRLLSGSLLSPRSFDISSPLAATARHGDYRQRLAQRVRNQVRVCLPCCPSCLLSHLHVASIHLSLSPFLSILSLDQGCEHGQQERRGGLPGYLQQVGGCEWCVFNLMLPKLFFAVVIFECLAFEAVSDLFSVPSSPPSLRRSPEEKMAWCLNLQKYTLECREKASTLKRN
jgi:hypothetical protein